MYKVAISHYLPQIMIADRYTIDEHIENIRNIKYNKFRFFARSFLKSFRYTAFATGNILKSETEKLIKQMNHIFNEN